MAYMFFEDRGTNAQRSALREAYGSATQEQREAIEHLYWDARKTRVDVYWIDPANFPGGNVMFNEMGQPEAVAQKGGRLYVNQGLSGEAMKRALINGMNGIAEIYGTRRKPAPPKPPKKPEPGVAPVDADVDTAYFGTENDNLYHKDHTGLEPAVFYATKAQAEADGKTADGVCIV